MSGGATLTAAEARKFYDKFGAKQDLQSFYEDIAVGEMIAHGQFERARSVFEFGCGTGRIAERLLVELLPKDANYVGIDLSQTMRDLAQKRLARFGTRAQVKAAPDEPRIEEPAASFDRFFSTYVFDLLSEADIDAVLEEAHRILVPGGLLCLTGLTPGVTMGGKLVTGVWSLLHRLRPTLVGGCRPVSVKERLPEEKWDVHYSGVVSRFGMASEVLVAEKKRGKP